MHLSHLLKSLGVSLSLIGVPMGMYFNQLFPILEWSPIFMTTSILLLIDWRGSHHIKGKANWSILIGFQTIMILYGLASPTGNMTSQLLSFHLYIIALCWSYMSNRDNGFIDYIPKVLFYSSLITTFLGTYFSTIGYVSGETSYLMRQTDNFYIEAFTVSGGAIINLFGAICIKKKNIIDKIIITLAIILDIYILVNSTKRTPVFIALIGIILYWYKQGGFRIEGIILLTRNILPIIILFIIAYMSLPFFQNMVDDLFTRFYTGIQVFFLGEGSTKYIDESAMARVRLREFTYDYISTNFTFFNYIFGAGYMIKWLDAPILEAFLDMGIIGFTLYSYIVAIIPFICVLKHRLTNVALLSILMSIYPIFSAFNSGHPYMYNKYTGVCFVIFIFYQMRNKSTTKRYHPHESHLRNQSIGT